MCICFGEARVGSPSEGYAVATTSSNIFRLGIRKGYSYENDILLSQVAPWIVWTWKTVGLLMPLLIIVMPFFLLSTMLDLMHQKGGHRLVVAVAPLLVGGIWASLLFQVSQLKLM